MPTDQLLANLARIEWIASSPFTPGTITQSERTSLFRCAAGSTLEAFVAQVVKVSLRSYLRFRALSGDQTQSLAANKRPSRPSSYPPLLAVCGSGSVRSESLGRWVA
jgi:hypothetical protein